MEITPKDFFKNTKLSPALKHTLKSMVRGKTYNGKITHSCNVPYKHVTVDQNLDCFICGCDGWLPIPVRNVFEFESLNSLWNSPVAKMLQDDVTNKKYTWCAVENCGVTHRSIKQQDATLSINIDDSCNLACPSCRRELRMIRKGAEYDKKINALEKILVWLEKYKDPITISLGGSGDGLASPILRPIFQKYQPAHNQKFRISTNGLLIKKLIPKSNIKSAISRWDISVDAASAEVYENVRRPGKWQNLLDNLEWLSQNRTSTERVCLSFTVQASNYKDLPEFVNLCKKLNFIGTIQPLNDWGTWNPIPVVNPDQFTVENGTYLDHNVANINHPDHQSFVDILNSIRSESILNISTFFNKFI